jgi:hypothetical protein
MADNVGFTDEPKIQLCLAEPTCPAFVDVLAGLISRTLRNRGIELNPI